MPDREFYLCASCGPLPLADFDADDHRAMHEASEKLKNRLSDPPLPDDNLDRLLAMLRPHLPTPLEITPGNRFVDRDTGRVWTFIGDGFVESQRADNG